MVPHRARLAQQWCSLVLFGFTLGDFLDDSCTRDHHVVELWSGVGSIVHGALQKGLTAVPFDKFRSSGATEVDEDILTRKGFLRAVRHVEVDGRRSPMDGASLLLLCLHELIQLHA